MRASIFLVFLFFIAIACDKDDDGVTLTNPENKKITTNDFLSETKYNKLIVEIQYVQGFAPTTATIDNLKTFLQERLNKSAGITVVQSAIPAHGKSVYSADDIRSLENSHRTQNNDNSSTLMAYFLFVDGDYSGNSGNSKVLGIAYGPTSMAIFEKTIKEYSGTPVTQPSTTTLETTVVLHEFGHILGLVNNGTGMQAEHQDEPHGKHCDDQNCLMYYTAETTDIIGNILGGNIPSLNTDCVNDLKANGGK